MITELGTQLKTLRCSERKRCIINLAKKFGVSQAVVRNWRYGQQIPFYIRKEVLEYVNSWRKRQA